MQGWIKIHRRIQDNKFWTAEPFTRGQAWVDLILLANHKPSFYYKRNVKINIERGQVGRSEVELSDRWRWSRTKVRKFINDLEKEQQVIQQKTNVTQILTIVNYNIYQEKEQQDIQQEDTKKTPRKHQEDTYKNVNNNKNDNNDKINIPSFEEFKNYTLSNDNMIEIKGLKLKYDAWVENGWRDGKDKKIKNWKSKILQTIPYLPKSTIKSTINLSPDRMIAKKQ